MMKRVMHEIRMLKSECNKCEETIQCLSTLFYILQCTYDIISIVFGTITKLYKTVEEGV